MFLELHLAHARRRRSRGFTLIELMAVVVIVGIVATMAMPNVLEQIRERRSRDMAQQIAALYTGARARALGRGAAVMVLYSATTGFTVQESIEGPNGDRTGLTLAGCFDAPGMGCLTTAWGTADQRRNVKVLPLTDTLTVEAFSPGGSSALSNMNICFSPGGRSFATYVAGNPSASMAGTPSFTVKRGAYGLTRRVVLLPNGTGRLAL